MFENIKTKNLNKVGIILFLVGLQGLFHMPDDASRLMIISGAVTILCGLGLFFAEGEGER